MAVTPNSELIWLRPVPSRRLGLDTVVHAVPSECWNSVRTAPPSTVYLPTAHASVADSTVTSDSVLSSPPALGLGTTTNPHDGPGVDDGDGVGEVDGVGDGFGRGPRPASAGGAATAQTSRATPDATTPASNRRRTLNALRMHPS